MRRLAHHLFTLFAAASLLLCVAAAAMAVRSFSVEDQLEYLSSDDRLLMLISKNGRLDVLYLSPWRGDDPGFTYMQGSPHAYGGTDYSKRVLGFGADVQLNGGRFVNIPYWFLALVAASPPLLVALKRIRHRRRLNRRGLCAVCGYDLRASPDRCPECGTVSSAHSTIERAVPVARSRKSNEPDGRTTF